MEFNKEGFAELLLLAKGKRSINKYANDTKVDAGYISRLSRCLIEKAPSAVVIKRLSSKAHNEVKYEHLMQTAGYLDYGDTHEEKVNDAHETIRLLEEEAERMGMKPDDPLFKEMLADALNLLRIARKKNQE